MRRSTRRAALLTAGLALVIGALVAWLLNSGQADQQAGDTGAAALREAASAVVISGDVHDAIAPGAMAPLDLSLENPNEFAVALDSITVSVTAVDAPRADAGHPCSIADFDVRQLLGRVTVTLGGNRTDSLSGLGVARGHWPAVGLLDRPVNQDGCQGATLALGYEASGIEVPR